MRMVRGLWLYFCLLVWSLPGRAASTEPPPRFAWVTTGGGQSSDFAQCVASDTAGNTAVGGMFTGTATFVGSNTLASVGAYDGFVSRYNASGELMWAVQLAGSRFDYVNGVALDGTNVLVTGSFEENLLVGSTNLYSQGGVDVFVAKFNNSGGVVWLQQLGGSGYDSASSIATDSAGNLYVAGIFTGTVTFGTNTLTSAGSYDIFLLSYDTNGKLRWARREGGADREQYPVVTVDKSGNAVLAGIFSGTTTIGTTFLTSAGGQDVFISRYNLSGTPFWSMRLGGASDDDVTGLAITTEGNIVAAGNFGQTINLGLVTLTNAGSDDIWVAQHTSGGVLSWARRFGGAGYEHTTGLALDRANSIHLTGEFSGQSTLGGQVISSSGGTDVLVFKLDAAGNDVWALRGGSDVNDTAYGIAADQSANVYVAGYYDRTVVFGTNSAHTAGGLDFFITRVTTEVLPLITNQPSPLVSLVATNLSLTVAAQGAGPLSYLWYCNGSRLTAQTNATLLITNAQAANSGSYAVVVTNVYGAVTSNPAAVTIGLVPPFLLSNPSNQNVTLGSALRLSVEASGSPPLSYQWQFEGTNLPGATSSILKIASLQSTQYGSYRAIVSNHVGTVTSAVAVVTENRLGKALGSKSLPWTVGGAQGWEVTTNDFVDGDSCVQAGLIADNEASTITTTVVGPGTLRFWWRVSSEDYDYLTLYENNEYVTRISGETAWEEFVWDVVEEGEHTFIWEYKKDLTDHSGEDTAWIDSVTFESSYPLIITQPGNLSLLEGGNIVLDVENSGVPPFTYQWYHDPGTGWNLVGSDTAPTLVLGDAMLEQSGDYKVLIYNNFGYVESDIASVSVLPYAAISSETTNGHLRLSWPATGGAFALEGTTNLNAGPWELVTSPRNTNETAISVTLPLGTTNQFFRLRR
jgi:hypothetical protein